MYLENLPLLRDLLILLLPPICPSPSGVCKTTVAPSWPQSTQKAQTPRTSELSTDLCLRTWNKYSGSYALSYIPAPDGLAPENDYLVAPLSQEKYLTMTDNPLPSTVIHAKLIHKGWIWDSSYEADFDLNTCLRYSDDGHVEFWHKLAAPCLVISSHGTNANKTSTDHFKAHLPSQHGWGKS